MKIQELLKIGYDTLKAAGIDTYLLDTQLILCKVLEKDKLFLITNRDITVEHSKEEEFIKLIELRKNKMPVKYILQECEFMGLDFYIKEGVLVPRADTEILVEEAINEIKKRQFNKVADVCSGSGVIGLSIAHFIKEVQVMCYDISEVAIEVTEENIRMLSLDNRARVIESDLLKEALDNNDKFDIIVSNPPYIKETVIPTLMEDVKNYEPFIALCGGEDGLDFYRRIVKEASICLNRSGILAFEIGYDQGEEVIRLLETAGFKDVVCIKDLAGNDRVVKGVLG